MLPSGIIRGYRHILLFIWHISAQQSFPLFTYKPEFFEAEPHFIRKVTRNTQLEVFVRVNVKLAISPRQSAQDPVGERISSNAYPRHRQQFKPDDVLAVRQFQLAGIRDLLQNNVLL